MYLNLSSDGLFLSLLLMVTKGKKVEVPADQVNELIEQ